VPAPSRQYPRRQIARRKSHDASLNDAAERRGQRASRRHFFRRLRDRCALFAPRLAAPAEIQIDGVGFSPMMLDPRFRREKRMKAAEWDGERGAGIGVDSRTLPMQ